MEDAIVNGQKIQFGHLGALAPQLMPPRAINMGFKNKQATYYLGQRIRYKFMLFRKFIERHQLRWFNAPQDPLEPIVNSQ